MNKDIKRLAILLENITKKELEIAISVLDRIWINSNELANYYKEIDEKLYWKEVDKMHTINNVMNNVLNAN